MSTSPFHTYAGLLERSTHLVHTYLRNQEEVVGYQFWGHRTVNDAYGDPLNSGVLGAGPAAMFQVVRGDSYRSPTLRRKKLGMVEESRRGTTHALFDVEDFHAPAVGGSPIPEDGGWMFLRVQENRRGVGLLNLAGVPADPALGPIYCIPPAAYFGTYEPTFTLQGTAPSSTASAAGAAPDLDQDLTSAAPRAMYLVFPKPLTALSIRNLSGVNLLVAFGPHQLMRNVPAGGDLPLRSPQTKEVLLACPDGVAGAAFSLHGVTAGETS
jgi:hypothetical protein